MDKIDERIIQMLQQNARIPVKEIAQEVFLSSPAVSARIDKLAQDGLIKGYHMTIDRTKLGYDVTAFISVEITPNQKAEFYPFIQACPNVLECSCVTGQYSQLVKVAFRSTAELEVFLGSLQQFGRTITQIVFSTPVEPRDVDISHR
ncbi:MAG: Lrp/AsnC family transcriptional regulator [Clostridia bacterium]|nr:Lrp/AsnC family transcriptional regulator [Clostridia bacterium]